MPFPITPTVFTVLTRVCAFDSKMSPMRTLIIRRASQEKKICIKRYRQGRSQSLQFLTADLGRYVWPRYVGQGNDVRYKHFSALLDRVPPFFDLVAWMRPPTGKGPFLVHKHQAFWRRTKAYVAAPSVAVRDDDVREIKDIRGNAQDTDICVHIASLQQHRIAR